MLKCLSRTAVSRLTNILKSTNPQHTKDKEMVWNGIHPGAVEYLS